MMTITALARPTPLARRGAYPGSWSPSLVFAALIHFQVSTWRQAAALLLGEE